jgi:hypothetical protein
MKYFFFLLLFIPSLGLAQKKGDNTITVKGIDLKQAVTALMDVGFYIDKIDSNYNTVSSIFKEGENKTKWMKMRFFIRIKDSAAVITGQWYNDMLVGQKVLGADMTIENLTEKIEYTTGNPKNCFNDMSTFAKTFGREISYSKK